MITVKDLKTKLESQFNLVCFLDLADLRTKHSAIFDVFTSCYQKEYQNNDRLVFYSSYEPEQLLIDHIQFAAGRIDISNFFTLFVSPFDLKDKLMAANTKYGSDDTIAKNLLCELENTKPFGPIMIADRTFLCPLPFMAVAINQDESVVPCCKYKGSVGNVNNQSIQDIFHGPAFKGIQKQMIDGQAPVGCETCVSSENLGSTSHRQLFVNKYMDQADRSLIDDPKIVDITISPANLCNFKCRICSPGVSTSIRSEEIHFAGSKKEKDHLRQIYKIFNGSTLDGIFLDLDPMPEFIHILGGEPFLWPGLPKIIDQLINTGKSKNIRIEFNTNGSIYPPYFDKIVNNFKFTEILISIDAIGERFELQRGDRWQNLFNNLQQFAKHNHATTSIKLTPTVNIQNLLYLDDLVHLSRDLGFDIVWNYLEKPAHFCIDNTTNAVKERVQALYSNHPTEELRKIARRVAMTPSADPGTFLHAIKKIDQRRNEDFSKSHQEICKLMSFQA